MKLVITNHSSEALNIDGSNVPSGQSIDIDNASGVLVVGNKPNVREQFAEAGAVIRDTIEAIQSGDPKAIKDAGSKRGVVSVAVTNASTTHSVRAILGDGVTDQTLAPSSHADLVSPLYIEFRELGHAPQQAGTPD